MIVVTGVNIISKLGPKIDESIFKDLEKEKITFDSGKIWVTFKASNIRGKGIYVSRSKSLHRGRFVITRKRLFAIVAKRKIINIEKNNKLYKKITIDKSNPERYILKVNLSDFESGFSGEIVLEYHINSKRILG